MNCFQPRRLGRHRLLIVGAGAVAETLVLHLRALGAQAPIAVARRRDRADELLRLGTRALIADLDHASSLNRVAALPGPLLMLAPPGDTASVDTRSRHLTRAIRRSQAKSARAFRRLSTAQNSSFAAKRWHDHSLFSQRLLRSVTVSRRRIVYVSTTGVYGQTDGRWVVETSRPVARSPRSQRRLDAEGHWRQLGASVLRAPGIYGPQRLPIARLQQGHPVLIATEDGWTNHIAEIDLARACRLAVYRGKPKRLYNVSDGHPIRMGDYFDAVADALGLNRPPRKSATELRKEVSPMMWSFMSESRRVSSARWQREMRLKLAYPTLDAVLDAARSESERS